MGHLLAICLPSKLTGKSTARTQSASRRFRVGWTPEHPENMSMLSRSEPRSDLHTAISEGKKMSHYYSANLQETNLRISELKDEALRVLASAKVEGDICVDSLPMSIKTRLQGIEQEINGLTVLVQRLESRNSIVKNLVLTAQATEMDTRFAQDLKSTGLLDHLREHPDLKGSAEFAEIQKKAGTALATVLADTLESVDETATLNGELREAVDPLPDPDNESLDAKLTAWRNQAKNRERIDETQKTVRTEPLVDEVKTSTQVQPKRGGAFPRVPSHSTRNIEPIGQRDSSPEQQMHRVVLVDD